MILSLISTVGSCISVTVPTGVVDAEGSRAFSGTRTDPGAVYLSAAEYFDDIFTESHEFHYTRLNNQKHRKHCSKCDFSVLENHTGPYYICMLGDQP